MMFHLLIEKQAINEMKHIPYKDQNHIKQKIKEILPKNPFPSGHGDIKKIKGSNFLRLRVGDYRIFFDVDNKEKKVYILSVKHRSKAYR